MGSKRVIPCSGKNNSITWCCGDSDACCTSTDQADLFSLSPTFLASAVSSTSSASSSPPITSSIPTTTSTVPPSSTAPPISSSTNTIVYPTTTPENTGLSTGAKAGIGIGAVAGAIFLVAIGIWISKAMAWRKDAQAAKAQNNVGYYNSGYYNSDAEGLYNHPQKYAYYAEADATTPPTEVLSYRDPVEVPDTSTNVRHSRFGEFFAKR
ncbi:hypothetical protein N0V90_005194 [Kalmusia sp. IMI 367209]|nr:hypothetical protein N0V90_005194 [Kalmusia sp. IMI 367209]